MEDVIGRERFIRLVSVDNFYRHTNSIGFKIQEIPVQVNSVRTIDDFLKIRMTGLQLPIRRLPLSLGDLVRVLHLACRFVLSVRIINVDGTLKLFVHCFLYKLMNLLFPDN